MNEFTPGPWRSGDHSHEVYDPHSGETICTMGNTAFPSIFPEANACLIAAAPELLEALKGLLEHCAMVHKYWGDNSNQKQADSAIDKARAAIAKAEGRES